MKLLNLDQNSPDWHKWRQDGLGGSDAGHVMGGAPWLSAETLRLHKKTGQQPAENERMARGKKLEPEARLLYQQLTGIKCRPVCAVHDTYPFLRVSLDCLSEDNQIVVEIKCPTNKYKHADALNGKYPNYYKAQLQHALLVTGLERAHFVSYHPEFQEHRRLAVVPVAADLDYQEELLEREKNMWESLSEGRS
jgi:putative phage-type endonuclease